MDSRGAENGAGPPGKRRHDACSAGRPRIGFQRAAKAGVAAHTLAEISHMIPLIVTASGTISTACPREKTSDRRPISEGDGTSPSRWIVNMLSATADARSTGDTRLMIAVFTGPVDMKRSSSATTIAG